MSIPHFIKFFVPILMKHSILKIRPFRVNIKTQKE